MNSFEQRNNKLHWELMIEFVDYVQEHSTGTDEDKAELDDIKLFLNNVVIPNEHKQKEGIDAWMENMHEVLDSKKVKYAKAIDRILTESDYGAIVYHAFAYHDLEAAYACSHSDSLQRLNLIAHNVGWTEAQIATMWKYFDELNRSAFEACSKPFPTVPTREEIARNIKSKKGGDSQLPTMQRAFGIAVQALCESRSPGAAKLGDAAIEDIKTRSVAMLRGMKDEAVFNKQIEEHDPSALETIHEHLSELGINGKPLSNTEWNLLTQVVTLGKVERAVPSNLMSQVEQFAHKLTGDLLSGKRDLSNLSNIESIGDELMSQMNSTDMSSLAEGVEQLLPALNMLKNTL